MHLISPRLNPKNDVEAVVSPFNGPVPPLWEARGFFTEPEA